MSKEQTHNGAQSEPYSLYRGVCSLVPGQSCWYASASHELTTNPVTVAGPIEVYQDRTIVPICGPQQDEPGYYFKADHHERKAYQRHENSDWNRLETLRVEF